MNAAALSSHTRFRCMPPATGRQPLIDHALRFRRGRGADEGEAAVRYRLEGEAGAPVWIVLGGISAGRRVASWWPEIYGRGRALDPRHCQVLSIDWLDRPWPDGTPPTSLEQARALEAVLDVLRIDRAHGVIGASYGAMVALALASHAQRAGQVVAISGAHASHPLATAWRYIQREIVRTARNRPGERRALKLARALALTTYRTPALFASRFAAQQPGEVMALLESYFEHQGERFCQHFDAERFLCLSESIDLHHVDPARIHCPVTAVAVDSDLLVPEIQMQGLVEQLAGPARLVRLTSPFGHDAFLKEPALVGAIIAESIQQEPRHAFA